jgi:DNA-binding GntR family transcriptional regulator
VTLLVPRLTPGDVRRLDAILHRMEAAARRRAFREFNAVDYSFHDALFEACDHHALHEAWKGMQRRIRAFQASSNWVSGDLQGVAARHRAILRALASRKLSGTRRALRTHFARLQEELDLLLAARAGGGGLATERSGRRSASPERSQTGKGDA